MNGGDQSNSTGGSGGSGAYTDPTQLAIEAVRKNKDNCDHIGFVMGFAMEMVQNADGSLIAVIAQNCMLCTKIFINQLEVMKAPKPTPPPPSVILSPTSKPGNS